jgi:outer membrane receptor protein involved in Fe transport
VTGGLTDFAPPEGGFLLDHDQRHTLSAGFDVALPRRAWVAGNVYYGSGFADEGGPEHLPGHTTVDLMLGKAIGESASISINALNVANRRYLIDNSLTFGGVHFAEPRQIFVQLRYRFRY